MLLGRDLEGPDFWSGVRTCRPACGDPSDGWLKSVAAVVQPAQFEEQPRRLLAALSAGVPVIATAGCGLVPQDGLILVPPNDPEALLAAARTVCGCDKRNSEGQAIA